MKIFVFCIAYRNFYPKPRNIAHTNVDQSGPY